CIAVFVAAGIAGERWYKVARWAITLSAVTYIIPLLFLFNPSYLGQGGVLSIMDALLSGTVLCVAISLMLSGLLSEKRW
ncbi:hypothetical protein Q4528_16080, partial [Staphylococcus pasteuri_A]|nr:hypothetical protein [Staphylococcus pasteuri_A]